MLLTMAISLYTSRVVLSILGASDYGLYNVVGGVVTMFSFLNSSLGAGTSRYISFELGKGDETRLLSIFNAALTSHIGVSLIIFVLAETVGLWFVNTQMVFDADRTVAVNVVYQMSVLTAMISFAQVPFTADIIAHEQMTVYAYGSIGEVLLKLLLVIILQLVSGLDSLIVYAVMIFVVQACAACFYRFYCIRHYPESKWKLVKEKTIYKEIISFSGWDILGNLTIVTQGQGINILLNIFFGPIVNAARAISFQVQGAFQQFTSSFMMAVNPQIIKSYAREEKNEMIGLINNSSLFAFYLLLLFMFPVLFKIEPILKLWLGEYPADTPIFTLLVLGTIMVRALALPIVRGTHATGDIKSLNIYAGTLGLLPLPIAWICFKIGAPAVSAFWIVFIWSFCANAVEIIILKTKLKEFFSIRKHLSYVYLRCVAMTLIVLVPIYFLNIIFGDTFFQFCLFYGCSILVGGVLVFLFGIPKDLRTRLLQIVREKYELRKAK